MVVQSNLEILAHRYSGYIEELHCLLTVHGMQFGSPPDILPFARALSSPGPFRDELWSLVYSILDREHGALPRAELLEMLAIAAGGPHLEEAAQQIQQPVSDILAFAGEISRTRTRQKIADAVNNAALQEAASAHLPPLHPTLEPDPKPNPKPQPEAKPEAKPEPRPTLLQPTPAIPTRSPEPATLGPQPLPPQTRDRPFLAPTRPPEEQPAPEQPESLPAPNPQSADERPFPPLEDLPLGSRTLFVAPKKRTKSGNLKFFPRPGATATDAQPGEEDEAGPYLPGGRSLWFAGACALILALTTVLLLHRTPAPQSPESLPVTSQSGSSQPAPPGTLSSPPAVTPYPGPPGSKPTPYLRPLPTGRSAQSTSSTPYIHSNPEPPAQPVPAEATNQPLNNFPAASGTLPVPASPAQPSPAPYSRVPPSSRTGRYTRSTPSGTFAISSGVMAGNLIAAPPPQYPRLARITHTEGPVLLQAVISRSGRVISARVLSGPRLLRGAASNAVRHWRYRPYLVDGRPVDVATVVTVDFRLPR